MSKYRHETISAYVLVAPFAVFFMLFIVIPVVNIVWFSFTEYSLFSNPVFIGFENYRRLFRDPVFIRALVNTMIYTSASTIPVMILGFITANIVNSNRIRMKGVLRVLFYMPYVPSMVSMAVVWTWFYDPTTGLFNRLLSVFGLPPQSWLSDPALALPSVIMVGIWQYIGYAMVIYLGGLQMIPKSLYEAADIEGAGKFRKAVSITLPMVKQTTFFLLVIFIIRSFNVFGQVNVMTQGGPYNSTTTVIHQVYVRAFSDFRFGYASAMSMMVLLIVGAVTMVNFKYGRSAHEQE